MVKGMTHDLFYGAAESPGLAQCLTAFRRWQDQYQHHPKPVLRALAVEMTDDEVDRLDKYRRDQRTILPISSGIKKSPVHPGSPSLLDSSSSGAIPFESRRSDSRVG